MKKEFAKTGLLFLSSVFLINFISAEQFSLGSFFNNIPPSTIVLGAVWIASFSLVYFAMLKFMKGEMATAAAVSFAISTFITWGVNKSGLNIENLFLDIGISSEILSSILPILIIGVIIILFVMLKTRALLVIGGILSILSFTNLIYEKTTLLVVGLIILGIGVTIEIRKRNPPKEGKKKAPEGIS